LKTRQGFVSNSSSSSFVAIGLKLDHKLDKVKILRESFGISEELLKKDYEISDIWHDEVLQKYMYDIDGWDDYLFCKIASGDEVNNLYESEHSFNELAEMGKEMLEKFGLDPKSELKIYTGMRVC
jgi:hypothetical protein